MMGTLKTFARELVKAAVFFLLICLIVLFATDADVTFLYMTF